MPKLIAHYGAGHLSLGYAVPWTPWLLLAEIRSGSGETENELMMGYSVWPGVILGIICLADVRWAAFAGILWLTYSLWAEKKSWQFVKKQTLNLVLAFLISAPLTLPLIQYTYLSTRSAMVPADNLVNFLNPVDLIRLFISGPGNHETMLYPGIVVLALSIVVIFSKEIRRKNYYWFILALLSLIFSLGENIPGMEFVYSIPGVSLLRVPSRALFLFLFSLSILAAVGMDNLLNTELSTGLKRNLRLSLSGISAFVLFMVVALGVFEGEISAWVVASAVIWVLCTVILGAGFSSDENKKKWLVALVILLIIDLGLLDINLNYRKPIGEVLGEDQQVAAFLAEQGGHFRVYSPSYSIAQQTAVIYGLELADGVDPLQLQSYVEYMEPATGVPQEGYSVTLPPFNYQNGDPSTSNESFLQDEQLLGDLNVRYIVSEYDLPLEHAQLVNKFGNTRVYELETFSPRVYTLLDDGTVEESKLLSWTPNTIRLSATGGGKLILKEINYPGWKVMVDGNDTELVQDSLFREVFLPPGEHTVVFTFTPAVLNIGLVFAFLGWAVLLVLYWQKKRVIRQESCDPVSLGRRLLIQ
ncbi:MAG: YfhO family protein [Anaerolineales bacterium]|nr:YfhO family protein [Anaerolineales bacterium]